jgi:signal transduction histidine kinase
MASLGSSIRSAARVTFSAYRSVPIRWRLAGGSAALTFVILAGFAVLVGHFTDAQVTESFKAGVQNEASTLNLTPNDRLVCDSRDQAFPIAAYGAQVRVFDDNGNLFCSQDRRIPATQAQDPPIFPGAGRSQWGYYVATVKISWKQRKREVQGVLLYGRPLSSIDHTTAKVQLILILGVLGGTVLALLAGLATAQRAIRPIAQLTAAAREIERTRDPSRRIPHIEAKDEVAELADTLAGMLAALDASRADTEAALRRQREFVADASHELRTPLTSVLANLELLADELEGEPADSAKSALRSTRRMRRLVGDLLLLARADADRRAPHRPTDLAAVLTDAAAELGPVAEGHELTVDLEPAIVDGNADDLHRLTLNLIENAIRHTPPGTRISARSSAGGGLPTLIVEDDGPGIPPELHGRVFERFVRGGGDKGGGARGTGLGLAIVRAVADQHGATVELARGPGGKGTRFVITFPDAQPKPADPSRDAAPTTPAGTEPQQLAAQTSTMTGSTIGRRRSRS